MDIFSDCFFEVLVIGGGTCGLAVTSRLLENCPGSIYTEDEHQRFHWLKQRGYKVNLINHNVSSRTQYKPTPQEKAWVPKTKFEAQDILVLDGVSDKFMGQWDNQFAACQIPFLRSPMFFHPDPVNVDGLVSYAHLQKREGPKDLKEIKNVVGKEYSKHQLKKLAKKNFKKKNPVPIAGYEKDSISHDKPGLIDINMRDWKDYYRPSTPLFHDFCHDIVDRYQIQDCIKKEEVVSIEYTQINVLGKNELGQGFVVKTASGKTFGCKICILACGHRGEKNYPIAPFTDPHFPEGSCHTTDLFSGKVKYLGQELINKPRASKSRTVVIVGGGLTSAQLANVAVNSGIENVHLLFRGNVKIKHFDFHLDWVTKYKNVKKSAFFIKDTDEERFQMIQDAREGGSVNPEYYKIIAKHAQNDRLNFMKYTTIQEQEWNDTTKTWWLKLKTNINDQVTETIIENVDYIYFATGITAKTESLDFLQPILKSHPAPIVCGLPCLTDNLQWNEEVPLFMLGKNASLKIGPASANLEGSRLGAERIGWYVQELKSQGKLDWRNGGDCQFCRHDSVGSAISGGLDDKLDRSSSDGLSDDSSDEVVELLDSQKSMEFVNPPKPTGIQISEEENKSQISSDSSDLPAVGHKRTYYETRLMLACNQLNWFSLLDETSE